MDDVRQVLEGTGFEVLDLENWEGHQADDHVEREEVQSALGELRRDRESYRHERQVKAEAEVRIAVDRIRSGHYTLENRTFRSAYFISNTRVLDDIEGVAGPVTMRQEAALHLVATLLPMSIAEAGILTNSLLNELAQGGLAVVDRRRVETAFGGFIDADRERLGQEVERHHALIAETYGEDLAGTFSTVDGIDVPITLESLNAQLADIATTALEREQKRVEQLRGVAALNSKEREEFERLKALAQQKATGGRAKRRAAASQKGRKRKKPGRWPHGSIVNRLSPVKVARGICSAVPYREGIA